MTKACGFKRKTPSHSLLTQFNIAWAKMDTRRRFFTLLKPIVEDGAVKGEVVAVDITAVKTYSQRSIDNKSGKNNY